MNVVKGDQRIVRTEECGQTDGVGITTALTAGPSSSSVCMYLYVCNVYNHEHAFSFGILWLFRAFKNITK
jgi:hypothetical protein